MCTAQATGSYTSFLQFPPRVSRLNRFKERRLLAVAWTRYLFQSRDVLQCGKSLISTPSDPVPSVLSHSPSRSATKIRKICCLLQTKSRLARNSWSLNLGWKNTKDINRLESWELFNPDSPTENADIDETLWNKWKSMNENSWIRNNSNQDVKLPRASSRPQAWGLQQNTPWVETELGLQMTLPAADPVCLGVTLMALWQYTSIDINIPEYTIMYRLRDKMADKTAPMLQLRATRQGNKLWVYETRQEAPEWMKVWPMLYRKPSLTDRAWNSEDFRG